MKNCIACAEEIQDAAKLCRYCQTSQSDASFLDSEKPSGTSIDWTEASANAKRAVSGLFSSLANPQSWNIPDAASDYVIPDSINCPDCGVRNSELDANCGQCGVPLPGPVSDAKANDAPQTHKVEPDENRFGSALGAQLSNRSAMKLVLVVIAAIALLVMITSTLSGGSSSPQGQSEMYRIGYSYAESLGVKIKSTGDSYQNCNAIAETYYYSNGAAFTQQEMDDWLQGCLAFVRN